MYVNEGGLGDFFVPNIALAENAAEVLKEIDIGASSAEHGEYICIRPCVVKRLLFQLTGELAGGTSVAPTVVFKHRTTPKSSSGDVTIGTLTIPDATAVGITVYKSITPYRFAVGSSLVVAHTIGTGTPTGMGHAAVVGDHEPETPANNSTMLASA